MKHLMVALAVVGLALAPVSVYAKPAPPPAPAPRPAAPAPVSKPAPAPPKPVTGGNTTTRTGTSTKPAPAPIAHNGSNTTTRTGQSVPRGVPAGSTTRVASGHTYYVSPRTGFAGHTTYVGYPYRGYYFSCWSCYSQPYWGGYYMAGAYVEPNPLGGIITVIVLILIVAGTVYIFRRRA